MAVCIFKRSSREGKRSLSIVSSKLAAPSQLREQKQSRRRKQRCCLNLCRHGLVVTSLVGNVLRVNIKCTVWCHPCRANLSQKSRQLGSESEEHIELKGPLRSQVHVSFQTLTVHNHIWLVLHSPYNTHPSRKESPWLRPKLNPHALYLYER